VSVAEFVLGSASNAASYLRLWAVSVARSQLAAVGFGEQALLQAFLVRGMRAGSSLAVFAGFALWLAATVSVLLLLGLPACFLHALRLHW